MNPQAELTRPKRGARHQTKPEALYGLQDARLREPLRHDSQAEHPPIPARAPVDVGHFQLEVIEPLELHAARFRAGGR